MPHAAEPVSGGNEVEILDGAGDGHDFFVLGLGEAAVFVLAGLHADSDPNGSGVGAGSVAVVGDLVECSVTDIGSVGFTEGVSELFATVAREDGEAPGLGVAVAGRPVGGFHHLLEDFDGYRVGFEPREAHTSALGDDVHVDAGGIGVQVWH